MLHRPQAVHKSAATCLPLLKYATGKALEVEGCRWGECGRNKLHAGGPLDS
jgi:hypothetical protein